MGHDDCDCGHDNCDCENEELDTIVLKFDDKDVECSVIGIFDVEDKEYIALMPIDVDTVLFFGYVLQGEEYILEPIDDDDLLKKVTDQFFELLEEENFDLEEELDIIEEDCEEE